MHTYINALDLINAWFNSPSALAQAVLLFPVLGWLLLLIFCIFQYLEAK
jgi:hypothetical protein